MAAPLFVLTGKETETVKLDDVDCAVMQWEVFWRTMEKLTGPLDNDIVNRCCNLVEEPGGMYEIARIREVDPALVILADALCEGMAEFAVALVDTD